MLLSRFANRIFLYDIMHTQNRQKKLVLASFWVTASQDIDTLTVDSLIQAQVIRVGTAIIHAWNAGIRAYLSLDLPRANAQWLLIPTFRSWQGTNCPELPYYLFRALIKKLGVNETLLRSCPSSQVSTPIGLLYGLASIIAIGNWIGIPPVGGLVPS